ncbi:MAG: ARPP-1 family domain-containing protein [Planctomycetota bacterium]|jgi:hypothetical protein
MVSIASSKLWQGIEAAEPRTQGSLRIVPLVGRSSAEPSYRLFDAESSKKVKVSEVDQSGSVPNIKVANDLDERLLLIDGQELLGAKQNRILNTDVLIAAHDQIVIPVSCVEQGRWGYRSPEFSPGKMAYSSSRANKLKAVHRALRAKHGHRSDQGEVWEGVQDMMCRLESPSRTMALSDVYKHREKDLAELRAAFELPPETVGIAVYLGKRFLGFDIFDRAPTFRHYWESLIDSYGLDWLAFGARPSDEQGGQDAPPSADELVAALSGAEWERFDAPGEGSDLRWESERLTASALAWGDDSVVHLQAFPRAPMAQ